MIYRIAVVDDSGLVQALAEGRVTVAATSSELVGRAELTVVAPPPPAERSALEALYRATGGNRWVNNENWLTGAPLSDWHGVSVNHRGAVIRLHLERNNLAGPIPSALADLTSLDRLHLGDNELTGPSSRNSVGSAA
ncbi:MAG: Ig-like domain-containing protein [Chloroflexota bacterium]|nr:Ig-like domain-containing protein [Chloroflexota bacterium]